MGKSAKFTYTTNTGKLRDILKKINGGGSVPQKADATWLGMNRAGKESDRAILNVFKFVGLIDSNGVPTDIWRALRAKDGIPLAQGIRAAYKELYDIDYNAQEKTDEELKAFFRKKLIRVIG